MTDIDMASPIQENLRKESFQLERWLVEPSANQLQCLDSGERRALEPRLMHLLCLLASAPGTVLSRDTLISQIWPRVIVNENSLTRAVSELRKKLEKESSDKRLIDTIPKTGYRLAADCWVCAVTVDAPTSIPAARIHSDRVPSFWQRHAAQWIGAPRHFAVSALTVASLFLLGLQISPQPLPEAVSQGPLADLRIEDSAALNTLIRGRVDKVVSTEGDLALSSTDLSNANGTAAVISRDGRLFAQIRYSDEGSSLLLGSTDLPNSPVTVLNTGDILYNLQWSPIDRALLFAQAPRMTPAAMLPDDQASLVMFDIDSFSTRVIQGPEVSNDKDSSAKNANHGFKLTSLSKHFDWLS